MQRNLFLAATTAAILLVSPVFSQDRSGYTSSDETIVLKQDRPRTEIEIRDGNVYVNGDKIVTIRDGEEANIHKRIIIENDGNNGFNARGFSGFNSNDDAQEVPHHAILGVLTDAKNKEGGAKIIRVNSNTPAEEAGLKEGDVIVRVNNKKIRNAASLTEEVGTNHRAGDEVTIVYERNGKTKTTTATLAKAPAQFGNARIYGFNNPGGLERDMPNGRFFREFHFPDNGNDMEEMERPRIGVSVEDREQGHGVRVMSVAPGSAAAKGGIREDDVITRVDDDAIESVTTLQDRIGNKNPGDKLTITYRRDGQTATTELTLPRTIRRKDL